MLPIVVNQLIKAYATGKNESFRIAPFLSRTHVIHYNPVCHRLCSAPQDGRFSTIHRLMTQGVCSPNWRIHEIPEMPESIWDM